MGPRSFINNRTTALIVTLVILIILATISVSTLFGENGLIKKVQEAKAQTIDATVQEEASLIALDARGENTKLEPNKFISSIEKSVTDGFDYDGINKITHKETGKEFIINKDYTISPIIEIRTAEELKQVTANGSYRLMNDIDLSGTEWTPLPSYTGTFDGNSHCINGVTINLPGEDNYNIAFFSSLNGGVVKNLALTNVNINGYRHVAGITAAMNNGALIENCFVTGEISLYAYGGGIATTVIDDSIIRNCYTDCVINVETTRRIMGSYWRHCKLFCLGEELWDYRKLLFYINN